jgi:urease accessory protein
MGAETARITAADFLTPPEFGAWELASNGAGRIGGVRLELIRRGGATRLGACYQQVPVRVLPPFLFPGDARALLYLLNPTAGLLDGDAHLVELTARAGTRTLVVGQTATRVHPCLRGFSTQQWTIRVEAGAVLVVLPGPTIPFRGSRCYLRVLVDLDPGAAFLWGDVGLAGRYARGAQSERFQFATWVQELLVRRDGRPAFRDRSCWRGPWSEATALWHVGGHPAWGTLFATGSIPPGMLPRDPPPMQAVFSTSGADTCARWCGPSERVTAAVVQTALRAAATRTAATRDDPWWRGDLAPVHWFSSGCGDAGI